MKNVVKKSKKKKTIGVMTQSRGVMPPPSRVKESKKVYKRQQLKKVDW